MIIINIQKSENTEIKVDVKIIRPQEAAVNLVNAALDGGRPANVSQPVKTPFMPW